MTDKVLYQERKGGPLVLWPETGLPPRLRSMPWPPGGKNASVRVNGVRFYAIIWERGTRWTAADGFTHRSDSAIKRLVRATVSGGRKACKEYLE